MKYKINKRKNKEMKEMLQKELKTLHDLITIAITRKVDISVIGSIGESGSYICVSRDWFYIMFNLGIYDEKRYFKIDDVYEVYMYENGSMIEFFPLTNKQKIIGRKIDFLYIYGDNEIDQESYNQLKMMTDEIYVNQFPFDPLKIKKLV